MEPEVQRMIDHYLTEVVRHLGSTSEHQRQEIVQNLEAHIFERLREYGGDTPTREQAAIVLAEMDAPASFGNSTFKASPGVYALGMALGSLLMLILIYGTVSLFHVQRVETLFACAYLLFIAGQMTAFILGYRNRTDPYGKAATILAPTMMLISVLFIA